LLVKWIKGVTVVEKLKKIARRKVSESVERVWRMRLFKREQGKPPCRFVQTRAGDHSRAAYPVIALSASGAV